MLHYGDDRIIGKTEQATEQHIIASEKETITTTWATMTMDKYMNNEFEINELYQATKVSMRTRIISATVACIIIFPLLFLGDWFFFALIAFVAVVAAIEIVNCAKPRHSSWLYIGTIVLILFLTFWPVLRQLFSVIGKKYATRNGGYTRILRVAPRRGDNTEMALIQLV